MKYSGQDDSGLKRLLTIPRFYDLFQRLLGDVSGRKWLVENFWELKSGEVIVDIGCGAGKILEFLPLDVKYLGIDISEEYIRTARRRFSPRGEFFLGTARDFVNQYDSYCSSAD